MQKTINTLKTEGATVEAVHLTCRSNASAADSNASRQAELSAQIMGVLARNQTAKVHNKYLPIALAMVCQGKAKLIDSNSLFLTLGA